MAPTTTQAVSGQTGQAGGGSAQAQPKEPLSSDDGDTGMSSGGAGGVNRREGDRPEIGAGSKGAKRSGEVSPTGQCNGEYEQE